MDEDTLLGVVTVCLKRKENEKIKRKKRMWAKMVQDRDEFTYQNLLEELVMSSKNDFRHFFIEDASIYEELLTMIGPLIKKKDTWMRDAIPVGQRLSTTLRFLATGDPFQHMTFSSGLSPLSISHIVLETCKAIISRLNDYIKLPESQEEWKIVANDFNEKWNIPSCLGAVAGKHIPITKPPGSHSLYYNHKKFFSVVLMAVVNSNYEFMLADVDINGRKNIYKTSIDQTLYSNSLNMKNCTNLLPDSERVIPYVFVADESFQLTELLIKPFEGDVLTKHQQMFNYRLGRVLKITENTFGTMSSLFAVLQKPINLAPEKVKTIVLACCYLYNFLKKKTDHYLWEDIFDKENLEDDTVIKGLWREIPEMTSLQPTVTKNYSRKAEEIRENLMNYFNNEGKVPGQYHKV